MGIKIESSHYPKSTKVWLGYPSTQSAQVPPNLSEGFCRSEWKESTQPAFTCSKLTIEILEKGVKYVQS